jgi:hypothetical protein
VEGAKGRHPLLTRLPLVLVLLAGLWFFTRGAPEQEILWQLPAERAAIERVEIQLRDGKGVLVQRAEFFYPGGAPAEISQKIRLEDARYEAQIHITRRDGTARTWRQPLELRGEVLAAPLRPPDVR